MVSVIIPTHNRPFFLRRAILSVINQSVVFEIIVIDDSSSRCKNKNVEIIKRFPSINYFSIDTKGVSYSRNFGASQAKSKYIAFLDDDDYWLKDYLESCLELAETKFSNLILTGFLEERNGILTEEKIPFPTLVKNDFFIKNPGIRGSNIFILRELFFQVKGFDENLPSHNDLDFGFRLFDSNNILYTNNPRYLVVFNNDKRQRLSSLNKPNKINGIIKFYNKYQNIMSIDDRRKFIKRAYDFWNVDL